MDIFVELENGFIYVVVLATSKNSIWLMDKENMNFLEKGEPFIIVKIIIVKKMTQEIIQEAIESLQFLQSISVIQFLRDTSGRTS
jgi:hypothetical protein